MYDFVIIGGGIIGMSTAMQLIDVYPDARIALLEKESAPACHQTGHNSGVIHAGVYYTPGSLKARFCLAGNQATKTFCDQNGLHYDICGKMLVATSDLEMARMRALWERTAANGLEREWLSAAELREREPNIRGLGLSLSLPAGLLATVMSRRPWRTAFRPKAARLSTMPTSARSKNMPLVLLFVLHKAGKSTPRRLSVARD